MQQPTPDFEQLLAYLQQTRGIDFTTYKPPSLLRRFRRRLQQVGVESFADYQDYLEVHPDEFAQLFNTVLINVTGFFRDATTWDYLKTEIIPRLIDSKPSNASIRVWSAGVASGQEAYSIAMLLDEALGDEAFRERVKIYATDVDEDALNQARQAAYTEIEVQGIPPALLEKYFERVNGKYAFRKDLRRSVIFGRHDLVQDAPISKIDLLISRNTLMYFNGETQNRILSHFHFALADGGYLVLGKSETMLTRGHLFVPIDLKRRVFQKNASRHDVRERPLNFGHAGTPVAGDDERVTHARLLASIVDLAPVAINEELETTNEELQSTNEELETTNEELQSSNEELETMNEELQSANEELERTNDELRRRTDELNDVNTFFESIMTSLQMGVVVLDPECRVRIWNGRSEDMWGLRNDEVHERNFLNLDFGLAVDDLRQPIRSVLSGEVESTSLLLTATNRRGRAFECEIDISPLRRPGVGRVAGVILLMGEHKSPATAPSENRG